MEKLRFKVIATDPLYARLLELELEGLGLVNAKSGGDYQILAAEGMCELPSSRRLRAAIFVDCGLLGAAMPEQVRLLILTKPFSIMELRKFVKEVCEVEDESTYAENQLIICEEDSSVTFRDTTVKLTPKEFSLLSYLHSRPGETITRSELLRELWKDTSGKDTNVVDVYVRFLRSKLDEPLGLRLIRAVRGEGYVYAYDDFAANLRYKKNEPQELNDSTKDFEKG